MMKTPRRLNKVLFLFVSILISVHSASALEADDFFNGGGLSTAVMNPNGQWVALLSFDNKHQRIEIKSTDLSQSLTLLDTKTFTDHEKSTISSMLWLDDNHLAVQYSLYREGIHQLKDTKVRHDLLIINIPQDNGKLLQTPFEELDIKSVRTSGRLVNPLEETAGEFLYAKNGSTSKIYRLKISLLNNYNQKLNKLTRIDGGQFTKANEIASINGYALAWYSQSDQPKAVLSYHSDDELILNYIDENSEATVLYSWKNDKVLSEEKDFFPIALADKANEFYCLDLNEDIERSIYRVNFKTGDIQLFYQTSSYKITDFIADDDNNNIYGVKVLRNGFIDFEYFDATETANAKDETSAQEKAELNLRIGANYSSQYTLAYRITHDEPGHYLLIDNKTQKSKLLGSRYPAVLGKTSSQLIEGSVAVDDLTIPYLLSLPKNASTQKAPLIVMPHGGPIGVHDDRYFDLHSQFLVEKGYGVLRVNFRGSSGYSEALEKAGTKQWGDGMLRDILEATKKVIAMPEVDEQRVCIMGFSYGGYAASMLLIDNPELFKCGVNVSGVSDLNLHLNAHFLSSSVDEWYKEQVGNSLIDYDQLKTISPIYKIQDLQRPIFVIHGSQDDIVDVEHAHRFKALLEKHNKPHQWKIYPDSGHHFFEPEVMTELMTTSVEFIDQQLK
ncbi:alpha/beta hydrolase family protein [Sessilibacter corallicola]|uniref:alpha/beta hydrolase family protein n=1 Tax=Sessilibacter corallicola TaxID=2904075 RepID=UPI001E46683F|nr:alpha/beta fold hydrolase [Sessilibacter corallicola]MCE2030015.1 prolyl oligopeptidase family serine peptidase [Sessilibacter corallicola]